MNQTRSRWVKWSLLIGSLLLLLLLLIMAYFYYSVMQEKTSGYKEAEKRAMEESKMQQIDSIERFHGDEPYFVLSGTDAENNPLFVYVPFDIEQDVRTFKQPTSYTKETVEEDWRKRCETCQLTAITPGIIEDTPVWEIKFNVNKDTYVYEYIMMDGGTLFEQIQYTRHFK